MALALLTPILGLAATAAFGIGTILPGLLQLAVVAAGAHE